MKFTKCKAFVAVLACALGLAMTSNVNAATVPLSFTKLTGVAGTAPGENTGVWVADLAATGLDKITSIKILDGGSSFGSGGRFSGADLDGVVIAPTSVGDATLVPAASVALDIPGAIFTEGTQMGVVEPLLVGTSAANTVDNTFATLEAIDANSFLSLSSDGSGYLSMGIGGTLMLNFATAIDPSVDRYLYIGEAGNNGETFRAEAVPEPSTLVLAGLAGVAMLVLRRRRS